MASLQNKVIAITGAGSGMGAAFAYLAAQRGARLSLADRNRVGLDRTLQSLPLGQDHISTVVDVTKATQVDDWIRATVDRLGCLDCAANFAGVLALNGLRKIQDESEENWDLHMNVNAKGIFLCLRAELQQIKAGGSIVSIASVAGQVACPNMVAYVASKHAVIGISRTAAKENPHVRVNCVAPGGVDTAMMSKDEDARAEEVSHQIIKRLADPVEIAKVVAFLLSDEASFVTGAVYNVDGGWVV